MPNIEQLKREWREEVKKWPEMDALGSADYWLEKVKDAYELGRKDKEQEWLDFNNKIMDR